MKKTFTNVIVKVSLLGCIQMLLCDTFKFFFLTVPQTSPLVNVQSVCCDGGVMFEVFDSVIFWEKLTALQRLTAYLHCKKLHI